MTAIIKPQFNTVWAATGMKTEPVAAKVNQGWLVEIPPFEYQNWITNRQDQMLAHINQFGIVQWDATVEYQANKSYIQGSDGVIYRARTTHINANPTTDLQGNWTPAFDDYGKALLKSANLADIPDKVAARTNLGITTTVEYDGRYLQKIHNLADVPNKVVARANLDIYSKQEVVDLINTLQPAGEVAAFATSVAPAGWLVCDGSLVSRTTYARLFEAIGTRYGAGNGSTTFQLPDLRGEFIRGADQGRGVDLGRVNGSWQGSQNLVHSHAIHDPGHAHGISIPAKQNYQGGGPMAMVDGRMGIQTYHEQGTHAALTGVTVASSGGNESRPRNVAMLYCIRT